MKTLNVTLATTLALALGAAACGGTEPTTLEDEIDVTLDSAALGTPSTPGCTRPGGWWKEYNRFAADPAKQVAWPIDEAMPKCGSTILGWLQAEPAKGDRWHVLLRETIATILNERSGAAMPREVRDALAQAKLLVGPCIMPAASDATVFALLDTLNRYNAGVIGPGVCAP
ncbi:hypothetical protein L6R52_00980 [Myxococcota bacterium]|nr:hypothetical protein [Myxococcota bacterium]